MCDEGSASVRTRKSLLPRFDCNRGSVRVRENRQGRRRWRRGEREGDAEMESVRRIEEEIEKSREADQQESWREEERRGEEEKCVCVRACVCVLLKRSRACVYACVLACVCVYVCAFVHACVFVRGVCGVCVCVRRQRLEKKQTRRAGDKRRRGEEKETRGEEEKLCVCDNAQKHALKSWLYRGFNDFLLAAQLSRVRVRMHSSATAEHHILTGNVDEAAGRER